MATHTSVSFDANFENPDFNKEGIWKHCLNSAKGAKINGNDSQCCSNIEKLYGECERLSEICKKKTIIINQRKKEYERFQRDKRELEEMKNKAQGGANASMASESDLKAKDAEIAYLEATLRKKEDENQKLKKDIERVLQDQMQTLEKIKDADQSAQSADEA
jgi:predicted RNase H-like nuclease (RuvC/YqgF family)